MINLKFFTVIYKVDRNTQNIVDAFIEQVDSFE